MIEWHAQTLGEVRERCDGVIKTGPFGSQLHKSDYTDDPNDTPVVMPKDIIDGRVIVDSIARIDRDTVERLKHHRLEVGDIVMARRGDIGRRALITDREAGWLCGTGSLRVSLPDSDVDPTFLHYFLGTHQAIGWLRGQAVGATMPNLNTDIVSRLSVPSPPLTIQRKIAAVLAAYDELIENNLRRIDILEEMAQAIYREWFVNFRYPGHDHDTLKDSPLGPIPEGWEVRRFDSLATSVRTNVDPSKHEQQLFNHYSFAAFDGGRVPSRDLGSELKSGKLAVEQKSVLLAKLNPRIPRIWLADPRSDLPAIASSEFLVLVPTERVPLSYVYSIVRDPLFMDRLATMAGGTSTSHQRLKLRDLQAIEIATPPSATLAEYNQFVAPMLKLAEILISANQNLRATRDLLLPRLISGQLDVSDLDIDTSWLAA